MNLKICCLKCRIEMKEKDPQIAVFVMQRNLTSKRLNRLNFYYSLLVLEHHYRISVCWAVYYCEVD